MVHWVGRYLLKEWRHFSQSPSILSVIQSLEELTDNGDLQKNIAAGETPGTQEGRDQEVVALMRQAERLQREIVDVDHPETMSTSVRISLEQSKTTLTPNAVVSKDLRCRAKR